MNTPTPIEISFLGGASGIGASCTLVRVGDVALVVDCGVRYTGPSALPDLAPLAETAVEASLCALGKSAPNPFLSTLRYFKDEYEAHIREKRCPAMSCKQLIAYHIDPDKCQACMICMRKCPVDAIDGGKKKIHVIDQDKCTNCGTCFEVCPPRFGAVVKISGAAIPSPIPEDERNITRKSTEK